LFENIREDWKTHGHQLSRQGLWAMVAYRFGRWRYTIRWRWLRMPFSFLYKALKPISEVLTGIELPCEATLGRRFRIDHFGGIVISGDAVFGDDCVIRNRRAKTYRPPRRASFGKSGRYWSWGQDIGRDPDRRRCVDRSECGGPHQCTIQLCCGWGSSAGSSAKDSYINGH
jgi:hypothetical protein